MARAARHARGREASFYARGDLARAYLVVLDSVQQETAGGTLNCRTGTAQGLWEQSRCLRGLLAACGRRGEETALAELVIRS